VSEIVLLRPLTAAPSNLPPLHWSRCQRRDASPASSKGQELISRWLTVSRLPTRAPFRTSDVRNRLPMSLVPDASSGGRISTGRRRQRSEVGLRGRTSGARPRSRALDAWFIEDSGSRWPTPGVGRAPAQGPELRFPGARGSVAPRCPHKVLIRRYSPNPFIRVRRCRCRCRSLARKGRLFAGGPTARGSDNYQI
jgi:hypothetical protein